MQTPPCVSFLRCSDASTTSSNVIAWPAATEKIRIQFLTSYSCPTSPEGLEMVQEHHGKTKPALFPRGDKIAQGSSSAAEKVPRIFQAYLNNSFWSESSDLMFGCFSGRWRKNYLWKEERQETMVLTSRFLEQEASMFGDWPRGLLDLKKQRFSTSQSSTHLHSELLREGASFCPSSTQSDTQCHDSHEVHPEVFADTPQNLVKQPTCIAAQQTDQSSIKIYQKKIRH